MRPILKGDGPGLATLKRRWSEVVGEKLAAGTEPLAVTRSTLTIRAPGAIAPFIQHQAPLILERCALLGAPAKALKIVQGAPQQTPPTANVARLSTAPASEESEKAAQADVANLPDGRLKAALLRLGRAVRAG